MANGEPRATAAMHEASGHCRFAKWPPRAVDAALMTGPPVVMSTL